MADESTGGDLISSTLTEVLAEAGKLPIRTDAREMQRAECDRLVREIGAKIEAIGPFAIPITFANMQAEGYMLSEPAQVAIDDPRDSKRRTLETFYIFVTSLGIYAARIFENQKRSGLMGKGDWKTHFRDHDYEYSSDRNEAETARNAFALLVEENGLQIEGTVAQGTMKILKATLKALSGGYLLGFKEGGFGQVPKPNGNPECTWDELSAQEGGASVIRDAFRESITYAQQQNAQEHLTGQNTIHMARTAEATLRAGDDLRAAIKSSR